MSEERYAVSLQQDLLTLLVHDEEYGSVVSKLVEAKYFEGDYRVIATKAIGFWQKFNKPPGQHIADLLSDILEDRQSAKAQTYKRVLVQMLEVKDHINREFVLESLGQFLWLQKSKAVIFGTAEILETKGIHGREEFETTLYDFLRDRDVDFHPGIYFSEYEKVLDFLASMQDEFRTGIEVLDEAKIVPMRGKIWIILAPTGVGKTWALVQIGRMALRGRKKVLHISLEIEAEEVLQRYYQAEFGATKREDIYQVFDFEFDDDGNFIGTVAEKVEAKFTFASKDVETKLKSHVERLGARAGFLLVKRFPMRSLTIEQLEAYLEYLEATEDFIPEMVVLDYPGIMKTDPKNYRISLGRLIEDLRGLSQRRNFALVAAHQGNRQSAEAEVVKATHAAEDWSVVASADFVVTLTQTISEKDIGLGRLWVDKGRSEKDKFGILITQSYESGQFAIHSALLPNEYTKFVERLKAGEIKKEVDG